jgi:hypothetical protein
MDQESHKRSCFSINKSIRRILRKCRFLKIKIRLVFTNRINFHSKISYLAESLLLLLLPEEFIELLVVFLLVELILPLGFVVIFPAFTLSAGMILLLLCKVFLCIVVRCFIVPFMILSWAKAAQVNSIIKLIKKRFLFIVNKF